ncbi:hypothetical protein PG988_006508 [Apiospora saccharicola]
MDLLPLETVVEIGILLSTKDNGSRPFDTTRAMEAYGKYRNFLAAEDRRNQSTDVIVMTNILRLLPNLKAITVRNLQPWGQTPLTSAKVSNLRKAIWISPSFGGSLDGVMVWLLKSIVGHPSLNLIAARGRVLSSTLCGFQHKTSGKDSAPASRAPQPRGRAGQWPSSIEYSGPASALFSDYKDVTFLDGDWASTIKGFTLHASIGMLEASEPACIRLAVTPGARILPDSVVTKPGTE